MTEMSFMLRPCQMSDIFQGNKIVSCGKLTWCLCKKLLAFFFILTSCCSFKCHDFPFPHMFHCLNTGDDCMLSYWTGAKTLGESSTRQINNPLKNKHDQRKQHKATESQPLEPHSLLSSLSSDMFRWRGLLVSSLLLFLLIISLLVLSTLF